MSSESLHPVCRAAGICWMLALHKANRAAMKAAGLVAPLVELVALPKKGKKGKKKGKKGEAAVRTVTDEATTRFYAIGALRSLTLEDPVLKVAAACTATCWCQGPGCAIDIFQCSAGWSRSPAQHGHLPVTATYLSDLILH